MYGLRINSSGLIQFLVCIVGITVLYLLHRRSYRHYPIGFSHAYDNMSKMHFNFLTFLLQGEQKFVLGEL